MLNDAIMVGVVLTLIFGAVVFYLYNRLSMTERKLGLFEGILTDLKVMMDAAPFASGPPSMYEFGSSAEEPITPEYLKAISAPVPLEKDEMEDVEYQQTLEEAFEPYRTLQVDESGLGPGSTSAPVISVTKLSPDLDSMTVKELTFLAKERSVSIPAGSRRKDIIEMLKKNLVQPSLQGAEIGSTDVSLNETVQATPV